MKILLVNTLYYPYRIGGAEVSVQLLAEELAARGHFVRVLTLHEGKERKVSIVNNVEVVYLPLVNLYWPFSNDEKSKIKKIFWHLLDNYNPFMARMVAKELSIYSPDIVHTNNISGFSVSIWREVKKINIRLVHTSRDYYLFHPSTTLFKGNDNISKKSLSVKIWSCVKKIASKHVDSFIGISDFIRDYHKESGFFKKATFGTIYNAVRVDETVVLNECPEQKKIGYIGRLSRDKGFDNFCNFIISLRKRSHIFAVSAGRYSNDKDSKILFELASSAQIEHLGFVDINYFLSKVDVVVLPIKWREPFGRVVIECALAGKVVVTSPVGGITELMSIMPNIVDMNSFKIEDTLISLSKVEQIRFSEFFSESTMAERYLSVYFVL
ncbi:glycosyltransferase family 4 protein [Serratia nevei]|uniref:glycosyltransferase family 4 protein n=1 Tax=Serratia TaxID=613 RepID=UPI002179A1F9|nr:glycosyltransferase family 4 protein [Serratia marcescens]CAI1599134.1 Glycosyl transferases group 1 [Serratia marcescens]